ncbi:hypothetical protein FOVSG1_013735 [Fusarium oxysporum f. sp. vasinfectum]
MASPDNFASAYHSFLSTLSDNDRARYDDKCTPQGLLDGLKKISSLAKGTQNRRPQKPFAIVRDFNERMRPFFAIIEGPVTQSSVYAGAALGALRLVLELASCFPTLLTKLLQCIKDITESFPRYEALEDICRGKLSSRLLVHLGRVYRDLFDFFDSAATLFTASSGKVRRPVELIASVIWRPFDERFGGILSSISKHQQQLNDEVNIYQLELTRDVATTSEEICKDTKATHASVSGLQEQMRLQTREQAIARIQSWLNAPNFASTYWNTLDECQDDTAQWIFEVDKFQEWSESSSRGSSVPDSKILWIHGNPGGGKSVLAASIVRELSAYNQNLVYFFFKEQSPFHTASDLAFRAILAQVLHKHKHSDDILDKFIFASNHGDKSSGQSIATPSELKDLLHLCLSSIENPIMILDGIDECTEPDRFVKYLKTLLYLPNLRALFSSRPTVQSLTKLVPLQHRLSFGQVGVEHDIHTYCHYHLSDLIEEGLLLESSNIQQLTRSLVLGADRMFLWAKLMLSFLRSPALNRQLRETAIWSDVLAFTSSKYLPAAQSTYQVPINSGTPNLPTGASQRLCHISATSSDGSVLGILSIWPSRKFEEFWETIHPSTAYIEVENYCENWHAVYELSRVGEPMEKLGTVSIPLQATEVALQMRQAFRQEHFSTWKASFPFSISFNGYSICVLRTIYRVTIDLVLSKLRIRSCRIPLEEIARIQHFWDDRLKIHDPSYSLSIGLPPTLQLLQRKVYTYRTIFDMHSHHILFQDAKKFEEPLLAFFEIKDTSSGEIQVRLVAVAPEEIMSSWLGCTGVPLATARFHPESSLIVSAIRGRVMAWDFSRNIMNHLSQDGAEVTSLSISACANYVVVMRKHSDSHEVYDLTKRDLKTANRIAGSVRSSQSLMPPPKQQKTHSSHDEYMQRLETRMDITKASGSNLTLAGGAGSSAIDNAGSQEIGCQLRIDAGKIKLSAPPCIGDTTAKSLELLSIPSTISTQYSRITLYLPKQDDNYLSVLVDKGIEDGYNMMGKSEQSLPVLVRKDKRLIREAIHNATGERGERTKLVEGTKRLFSEVDKW